MSDYCQICLNVKRPVKFKSNRIKICQWCITLLIDNALDKGKLDAYVMDIARKHISPPPSDPLPHITKEAAIQIAREQVGKAETIGQFIIKSIFANTARHEQILAIANKVYQDSVRKYEEVRRKYREELSEFDNSRQSKVLQNYHDLVTGQFSKVENVSFYAKSRYRNGRGYLRSDYKDVLTESDKNELKKLRAINLNIMAGTIKCTRLPISVSKPIKVEILKDDDYKCSLCGKPTPEGETHLHHIIPIANFGSNHENNLIPLCYTCHNKQHKRTVSRNKKRTRRTHSNAVPTVFVAIDIETTGLDINRDRIVEISAVKFVDGCHSENYTTFINPQITIPSVAIRIHGIDNSMVSNAPQFEHVVDKFIAFIGEAPLVGHCLDRFDMKFISKEVNRVGKSINNDTIDTLPLSRKAFPKKAFPQLANYQLTTLKQHLDIQLITSHRAYEDALSAGYLYLKCLQKLSSRSVVVSHDVENRAVHRSGDAVKEGDSVTDSLPSQSLSGQNNRDTTSANYASFKSDEIGGLDDCGDLSKIIVICYQCGEKMKVPRSKATILVKCPKCPSKFFLST